MHSMVASPGAPQLIVGVSRGIPGLAFSGLPSADLAGSITFNANKMQALLILAG
jgi:hypothetical protein